VDIGWLKRVAHIGTADVLLLLAFGLVIAVEIALLRRPRPPPLEEQVGAALPELDAESFDADFGVTNVREPSGSAANAARIGCAMPNGSEFFFPRGTFREMPARPGHQSMDRSVRVLTSTVLRWTREPSLSCRGSRAQVFRFLWEQDFRGTTVIRVVLPADPAIAPSVHVLDEPARPISLRDQREFVAAFERTDFWTMPTYRDAGGGDGASWIVEARVGPHHHVVDRWSPGAGPFRDLGLSFMRLAGLPTDGPSIY
jgi:hypothetical protein